MTDDAVKDTTKDLEKIEPTELQQKLPKEIQLTELEVAKLTAVLATLHKTQAEIELFRMQAAQEIQRRMKLAEQLTRERIDLINEISIRVGVPDIDTYDVDPKTGKGVLSTGNRRQ